jgi:23S rRNA pseudouridine1911/1915/1917 synthase
VSFTVSKESAGKRLDQALQEVLPQFSRARLQQWIRGGHVRVNGSASRPSQPLREGDRVEVEPQDLPPLRARAESIPLEILYEDEDLVAIDKPAGMVVHSGAGAHSGTLVNALLARFSALSSLGGEMRPGIVHRLDRHTSGVLLVAKNDAAHRALSAQFASRTVKKTYLALVHGAVRQERGRVEKPITRDPRRRIRMTARLGTGREASTEYRVLRRWEKFTLLEVKIGTGRTHQIRVHLASLGHPVVGDALYGAPSSIQNRPPLGRYFLHAHRIEFQQPRTGLLVEIESPLPRELTAWMAEPLK